MKRFLYTLISVCLFSFYATAQTWSPLNGNLYFNTGNIGIGTTNPSWPLQIERSGNNASIGLLRTGSIPAQWYIHSGRLGTGEFSIGDATQYRFVIGSNGNVGIGTSTPTEKLTLKGNGVTIRLETESNPSSYNATIQTNFSAFNPFNISSQNSNILGTKVLVGGSAETYLNSYYGLAFSTHTTNPDASKIRMFITQTGNVGIGTTSPSCKIHADLDYISELTTGLKVSGRGATTLQGVAIELGANYTNGFCSKIIGYSNPNNTTNSQLAFQVYGGGWNTAMYIKENGFIGIGTTSPDMPLTVKSNTTSTQYTIKTLNNAGNYTTLIGKSGESGILYVGDGAGNAKIQLYSAGVSYLNGGDVGIGTTAPVAKLDVAGHIAINSHLYFDKSTNKHFYCIGNDGWDQQLRYVHYTAHKFYTNDASTPKFVIAQNGNVGIGTTNPTAKLAVNGLIKAHEVKVTIDTGDWPDFVFSSNYQLRSLSEVEQFITENNHLPDVPNQAEVMENGVGLGEMNAILLQKVEELTLYLIQSEKKRTELEERVKNLEINQQQNN